MGSLLRISTVAMLATACSDAAGQEPCVDFCADPEETRSFPGPCRSRLTAGPLGNVLTTNFEYDAAGNLVSVDGMMWMYDASGAVTEIRSPHQNWHFGAERITRSNGPSTQIVVYDRASFRLAAMPGRSRRIAPYSDFGLISRTYKVDTTSFTEERTGQTLTRTGTRNGSPITTEVSQLDDRDRVIASNTTPHCESYCGVPESAAFEYVGDLLVRHTHTIEYSSSPVYGETRWTYDLGGNVILEETLEGDPLQLTQREAFDYTCWE